MRRGRRFGVQIAVLPVLWALASIDDTLFTLTVGALLIAFWPLSVAVAVILNWLVGESDRAEQHAQAALAKVLDPHAIDPIPWADGRVCVTCGVAVHALTSPPPVDITIGWEHDATAVLELRRTAEAARVPATLREAADNAATTALIATGLAGAGAIALARIAGFNVFTGRPVLVLLSWALVLVAVPSISWLGTLRRVWIPMLGATIDRFRR